MAMLRLTKILHGNETPAMSGKSVTIATSATPATPATPQMSATSAGAARLVTLSFEDRRRSRLLIRLDDGGEAALMLPRGTVLREGDRLVADEGGPTVQVRAAAETLSVARTSDASLLSRGAYHLGNRHVPLQIGPGWLAYQHDHVLDDLARALGLAVTTESAPFEPEAGGYRHQGSERHHDHDHDHDHNHAGAHGHQHGHGPHH
jgi:urease accessory protein